MNATDKKLDRCKEIARLQDEVVAASRALEDRKLAHDDANYQEKLDAYIGFLLNFVGSSTFVWDDTKLARLDRLVEVRTKYREAADLMKIAEDYIPPVAVREMMIGDEDGPFIHMTQSYRFRTFLARYPFILGRGGDA